MSTDVLILANRLDFSTDILCSALEKRGVSYLRCNREDMTEFRFQLDPLEPKLVARLGDTEWIIDNRLKSVWWRQPTFRRISRSQLPSASEQLDESQWSALIRGLALFGSAKWFNEPARVYRAESKILQLSIAAKVGLHVPDTIVTNDAQAGVAKRIGDEIALKSIDTVYLVYEQKQAFGYTQLVNWKDCADGNFHLLPAMCQKVIRDKLDLRVTIVGDQLWCHSISTKEGGIDGDWRLQKRDHLVYETYELPDWLKMKLLEFMRALGLNYGAIDLGLSDGIYWFIEVNPTGEWAWLDGKERAISSGIIEELAKY